MIPLNNAKERLQGTMEMENDALLPPFFFALQNKKRKAPSDYWKALFS